jgi:UDP-2-acetamido-2-deoxy-ribo-hexuluronate aminotransferase
MQWVSQAERMRSRSLSGRSELGTATRCSFLRTRVSRAWRVSRRRARPVLVDVVADTHTVDPAKLEASIGPRCRAILPVHLYGQCADVDAVSTVARSHGLAVVEDAAQAHGAA